MTEAPPFDILDLRHFSAADLKPLLAAETEQWKERLHWDYRSSTDLILRYLDSRVLPGYVAAYRSRVIGYIFCVYEEAKAVIGDVYSTGAAAQGISGREVERQLVRHLVEMLQNSPGTERIEAQLLLHPSGRLAGVFRAVGFETFRRDFMEMDLEVQRQGEPKQPAAGMRMRAWNQEDLTPAAHLIADAYAGHLDSRINDQYQSVGGSMRFLHNIIRFPGCGRFDAAASRVVVDTRSETMQGVLLCSEVEENVAHITQVCVAHKLQGHGLGAWMMQDCAACLNRRGFKAITLTVTQENRGAVRLYHRLGFTRAHTFDAVLWLRPPLQLAHLRDQVGTQ